MPKKLTKAQRALMLDIMFDINNNTFGTYEEFLGQMRQLPDWQEWMLQWPLWSAGENIPGFMPDIPYSLFLTERSARGYRRALKLAPVGKQYVYGMISITLQEIW